MNRSNRRRERDDRIRITNHKIIRSKPTSQENNKRESNKSK
jgi:hypothetical protein